MNDTPTLIVVAGPTASGKTALGIELAKKYGGEIVSADSMQIYRGMDIGTAKATAAERAEVPHHMIDAAEPFESWSVSRWVEEADKCCRDILSRGKIPVVVGGTGLYIDSLIAGRSFAEIREDMHLRRELEEEYDRVGGERMLEKLREFDPERALKLSANDRRRIVRAIEIYQLTGKTASEHDAETRALPPSYTAAYIVLSFKDRAVLYDRIDRRVDKMLAEGLFDEVRVLSEAGLDESCTAMQAIGYKEAAAALRGEMSGEEAAERIKRASRRYAKRQLTWFSKHTEALRLERENVPDREDERRLSSDFLAGFGLL